MMRQEKLLIKWPVPSDWVIRAVQRLIKFAKEGNPDAIAFPRAKVADAAYDFSFSGIEISRLELSEWL